MHRYDHPAAAQKIGTWLTATIKGVVDLPEDVKIHDKSADLTRSNFIIRVHQTDVKKLIGCKGRTINSIRALLVAMGGTFKHSASLHLETPFTAQGEQ